MLITDKSGVAVIVELDIGMLSEVCSREQLLHHSRYMQQEVMMPNTFPELMDERMIRRSVNRLHTAASLRELNSENHV